MYTKYIYLKEIPLLRLGTALLTGTLIGILFPIIILYKITVALVILLIIASYLIRKHYSASTLRKQTKYVNLFLFTTIFLLSYSLTVAFKENLHPTHFTQLITDEETVAKVRIQEVSNNKQKTIKLQTTAISLIQVNQTTTCKGNLLLYLERDTLSEALKAGNILLIKGKFQAIPKNKNPHEFDYQAYLAQENISHSSYIPANKWRLLEKENMPFKSILYSLRNHLQVILDSFLSEEASQVANAILLGNKDFLEPTTIKTYAETGAMHVLAVSGLHVGIVYLVFHYLFFFLKNPRFKLLKALLIILLLWSYAIITGGSPSVLRATTMFTFISLGSTLKQHVNIYNLIAASAFVLILVNPFVILALGFQLSYLAVIGIIYLQPKIYKLLVLNNYILDKIWGLTSVSIAAQLATFPLGLLYFNQFPNYFWLSNLIVIPAAILIVYLGMSLFLVNPLPYLPDMLGWLLSKLIMLMNAALALINTLPFALSSGIYLSVLACIGIYAFIISFSIALIKRNKYSFILSLVILLCLLIVPAMKFHQIQKKQVLRVYHISKTSAIELQDGFHAYHYFDQALLSNENTLNYSIQPNWSANHIQAHHYLTRHPKIHAIYFANKTIFVIDSAYVIQNETLYADYLVITHQNKLFLQELNTAIHAGTYIFDSSNNPYQLKYWKKDCEDLNLNCYFVSEDFAYEENLNE